MYVYILFLSQWLETSKIRFGENGIHSDGYFNFQCVAHRRETSVVAKPSNVAFVLA